MAEDSTGWTTGGAGDGAATLTRADWSDFLKIAAACMGFEGVAPGYLNSLVGSSTGANNCRIGTGGAMVDGKPYWNTANVDTVIPSAVGGGNTRIDRIVLRADWTAQTVRITKIAGTDAASPTAPAVTTTSGTTYDIKLYQVLVNTSGAITLTDERSFAKPVLPNAVPYSGTNTSGTVKSLLNLNSSNATILSSVSAAGIGLLNAAGNTDLFTVTDAGAATIPGSLTVTTALTMPNDTVDDTKVGNRVIQAYRRQGGDASQWDVAGTTTYTPAMVREQFGTFDVTVANGDNIAGVSPVVVTFPVAFSQDPIVFCQIRNQTNETGGNVAQVIATPATTGFGLQIIRNHTTPAVTYTVMWRAIGTE